jgi:hypothetical protein
MRSDSFQKRNPGSWHRRVGREKDTRGQRREYACTCLTGQTGLQKNSYFRFDPCLIRTQVSFSKPAGPLSQDMLSLGGSFFVVSTQPKRKPGSWYLSEVREKDTRGVVGNFSRMLNHLEDQPLALDVMGEYVVFLKTEEGGKA